MENLVCDREIATFRVLHHQRELVFRAFSDPHHLVNWWGPKGFANTFHEFNLQSGEFWRFTMHGPNGADYTTESIFVEVKPSERIVLKHLSSPQFEMTITLDKEVGKTRIGWRQRFNSAEECERIKKFAVEANEQNLDRLEAELSKMTT